MTVIPLLALIACALVGGCAMHDSGRARYGDPNEIVAGTPDSPTMYDLGSSADSLIQKMLGSSQFYNNHNFAKTVLGDLRHFADIGGYHTYRLRLALHNLKTGKVVWEGTQTKVKL